MVAIVVPSKEKRAKSKEKRTKDKYKSNKNYAYELRALKKRPSDRLDNYTEDHR